MFSVMEVKRDARAAIRSAIGSVLLVSFVYVLITELLANIGFKVIYGDYDIEAAMVAANQGAIPEMPKVNPLGNYLYMAMYIMMLVIAAGFSYYALLVSRWEKAGVGEMFDIFSIFFRALGLVLLRLLYVFLWSLLFVIPGIIAAYRYSMALFIMLDRPDLSVVDCLRMSKEMTMGNKGRIFALDLSFIGWRIASFAVSWLLSGSPVAATICAALINVVYLPYYTISTANVYNRLSCWQPKPETTPSETTEEPWEQ